MSVSSIQSTIDRIQREINDLSTKIVDKRKRSAEAEAKASKAIADARKTKSSTTAKSKFSESERYSKEAIKLSKEMSELEKKKVAKEKQLQKEQQNLQRALNEEAKKAEANRRKIETANERKIQKLTQTVKRVELAQSKIKELYPLLSISPDDAYDVFISHASEDKATFVDELVEELSQRDVKVWYDRRQLTWGKSIRQSIDKGLQKSKFAIVVLSEFYIQKYWTQKEFNALFALGSSLGDFILPIWHNITPERAKQFSPMLGDAIAIKSSELSISEIADMFVEKLNYDNNG